MKKQKINSEEVDLSRFHILSYEELLKVNGGSSEDSDDSDDDSDDSDDSGSDSCGGDDSSDDDSDSGSYGGDSYSDDDDDSENGSYGGGSYDDDDDGGATSESGSGGHEVENSNAGVAGAEVGDTITRDDGTEVTLTQGDIDWAQDYCDSHGISYGNSNEPAENSSGGGGTGTGGTGGNPSNENGRGTDPSDYGGGNDSDGGSSGNGNSHGHSGGGSTDGNNATSNSNKNNPNYPDYVERSMAKDKEISEKKNSELNSPKGNGKSDKTGNVLNSVNNTLRTPSTLVGFTSDLAKESAKNIGKSDLTATAPNSSLMTYSKSLSNLGVTVVAFDVVMTAKNEINSVNLGKESASHAAYNTITHGISTVAGYGFGAAVTLAATASTVGIGSVPGLAAGIIAGTSASTLCDKVFDYIEDRLW